KQNDERRQQSEARGIEHTGHRDHSAIKKGAHHAPADFTGSTQRAKPVINCGLFHHRRSSGLWILPCRIFTMPASWSLATLCSTATGRVPPRAFRRKRRCRWSKFRISKTAPAVPVTWRWEFPFWAPKLI